MEKIGGNGLKNVEKNSENDSRNESPLASSILESGRDNYRILFIIYYIFRM